MAFIIFFLRAVILAMSSLKAGLTVFLKRLGFAILVIGCSKKVWGVNMNLFQLQASFPPLLGLPCVYGEIGYVEGTTISDSGLRL